MPENTNAELLEAYRSLLDSTRREILDAMPTGESRGWKILTLVLPVVLTSLLGLWVSIVQTNINTKVEAESTVLQGRLALTQDYYRERLQTYKQVHERVVALRETTRTAADQAAFDAGLDKPIGDLYSAYSNSSIFIPDEILRALTDLWSSGIGATRSDTVGTADIAAITSAADRIETLMRKDLHVEDRGAPSAPP